ncbi:MAG: DUF3098 domain-containing protein [Bacteroidales bacterium]|jgi:uncharacterized membrane protein|nr:DUF3098 domain-containing protein [Bacteroidales bacterium]
MDNKLALGKQNLILIGIGMLLVVIGFILMTGVPSEEAAYNPDIFSFRRIVLGPGVSLFGFLFVIFGILKKDKHD